MTVKMYKKCITHIFTKGYKQIRDNFRNTFTNAINNKNKIDAKIYFTTHVIIDF